MAPDERCVSVEKVAAHLRVEKDSIYRKVGRILWFRLSAVHGWVEAGGGEGPSESDSQSWTNARSPKKRSSP